MSEVSTSSVGSDEYFKLLTPVNHKLYFVVQSNEDGGGVGLWKTDANRSNAVLVRNFRNIVTLINFKGNLFFIADDGKSGNELWKTNGTIEGTILVKDIRPGMEGSDASSLTNANGNLYFVASDANRRADSEKKDL